MRNILPFSLFSTNNHWNKKDAYH